MKTMTRKNFLISALALLLTSTAMAAPLSISQSPLFLSTSVPPLNMIVMGRDHTLYNAAYDDASDITGDGLLDITYQPTVIDYTGYFDSYKCYSYSNSGKFFSPVSITSNKKCSGSNWSGDFLNYITTSRVDALRKVLYGGYRSTDSTTQTILERSYIPQDAHGWGKEYTSSTVNGYNISDYAPLSRPSSGNRILFANTTLLGGNDEPIMRVANNIPYRIWEWTAIERPTAGTETATGNNVRHDISNKITDYSVRVKVCVSTVGLEANCELYPNGSYKPTGLLQQFGESNSMMFGLITGSYSNNLAGGVLRKNMGTITNEINSSTGQYTSTVGIIKTIDRLKTVGFGGSYEYNQNCGWITDRPLANGECRMWGNPVGEMMYEALRYFAGKGSPTGVYNYPSGGDDDSLGLPKPAWSNPYTNPSIPWCSKPSMLVVSNIEPSYDSDQVPGNSFASFSGDLPGLDVSSIGQLMWNNEIAGSLLAYIGQSGAVSDNTPAPKTVTSFGNIRGLPNDPGAQGSYSSSAVAYYGWTTGITIPQTTQFVKSFIVALSAPTPQIKIPVNGKTITLIPFAKSVGGCLGVVGTQGAFQPTNEILSYYVQSLTPTSGTFLVDYSDVQQGSDNDMDALITYNYVVNGNNTVTVTVTSSYAAGCIIQHLGYIISGTTADGIYLVVRDSDTAATDDVNYFLDTPLNHMPTPLPLVSAKTFTPSATVTAATILNNPLWYAAKWGGFTDKNNNNIPDQTNEWDTSGNATPDNYFLVTSALNLNNQLSAAFQGILARTSSAASASVNTGTLTASSFLYQTLFSSATWTGQLLAFPLDPVTGNIITTGSATLGAQWDAGALLGNQNYNTGRVIITYKPSLTKGIPFRWPTNPASPTTSELDLTQVLALNTNPQTALVDNKGSDRLNYVRGSQAKEVAQGGTFRNRSSLLGDVVDSAPFYVGAIPAYTYSDTWASGAPENSVPYSSFITANQTRTPMIYVGANDGMLHGFNATTGVEVFSYIPSSVFNNLNQLTSQAYTHLFYVDGSPNVVDAFYAGAWHSVLASGLNAGGQGIFAIDVTNPSNFNNESNAAAKVLWEFSDKNDSDMGYTYSQPAIVRLNNGVWAAIFGNGLNNTMANGNGSLTGDGTIYIVNIQTGALIKKFDTLVGTTKDPQSLGRPNGIATVAAVDRNGDSIADVIYAGDLFGNIWKIDISSSNPASWDFAYHSGVNPAPFFVAKDANGKNQPITSRINVVKIPNQINALQLFFGTGKYLEIADKTNTDVQTFYSLRDFNTVPITGRSQLIAQTILGTVSVTAADGTVSTYRATSSNTVLPSALGWYMDLRVGTANQGERVVTDAIIRGNKVIFTTLIPSTDPCSYGGTGWLMELNYANGNPLSYSPFDTNGDGKFTTTDSIRFTNGSSTITVPASGIQSTVGLIPAPSIISAAGGEHKYMPGSSGQIQHVQENPGSGVTGRQSWKQMR